MATFDSPHFTIVLPDISELTVARLDRSFDDPISNPARRRVTVGSEDADPAIARILSVDDEGRIELEVLRGPVEAHRALLASA